MEIYYGLLLVNNRQGKEIIYHDAGAETINGWIYRIDGIMIQFTLKITKWIKLKHW